MKYMNEWDIQIAQTRYARHPVKAKAAKVLDELRTMVNFCSDGWCYWKAPVRAARKLMELIEDTPDDQATEAAYKAAVRPVKAFLTRHKDAVARSCMTVNIPS